MANDISKLHIGSTDYDIKDATARTSLLSKIGYADYRTHDETVSNETVSKHYIYFYKQSSDAPSSASTAPSTYLCRIDAAPFVKDGMVSSVTVSDGNLVITWNSDSTGVTSPTNIPLTDIFNPSNYLDKTQVVTAIGWNDTTGYITYTKNSSATDAVEVVTSATSGSKKPISSGAVYSGLDGKANKSELSITAVTGSSDKKNIQLKNGTAQEVLIAHQDISGKADKSSTVSTVTYDETNDKLTKTINGSTTDIVSASTIVTDGGGYKKPSGGIPSTDLASAVTTSLGKADTAYQKPSGGIPSSDMTSTVQTSLGKADTSVQTISINSGTAVSPTNGNIDITIPSQVQSDWSQSTNSAADYIKNKPTNVSDFTNDAGYQTSSQVSSAISTAVSYSYTSNTETLNLIIPAASS